MRKINVIQILKVTACVLLAVLMIGFAVSALGATSGSSNGGIIGGIGGTTGGNGSSTGNGGSSTGSNTGSNNGSNTGNNTGSNTGTGSNQSSCKHLNQSKLASYVDADTHSYSAICLDCRKILVPATIQPHTLDANGKCTVPGCSKGCIHDWTTSKGISVCDLCKTVCEHDNGFVDGATVENNETGHWLKGECLICGYTEARSPAVLHTLDSAGHCTGCNYQCKHLKPSTVVGDKTKTQHTISIVCKVCGYVLTSGTVDHEYGSAGFCSICGYNCDHEFPADATDAGTICTICGYKCKHDVWYRADTDVEDFNDRTHAYMPVCQTCNMLHYEYVNHSFVKGTCSVCGHVCVHPEVTSLGDHCNICLERVTALHQHTINTFLPEVHEIDDVYHKMIYRCKYCDYQYTVKESHVYTGGAYGNGKCDKCLYACTHAEGVDENGWCATCGKKITETTE